MSAVEAPKTFRDTFHGNVNVGADVVLEQVKSNLLRPLPQVRQYPPNDYEVALLCGGPSLARAELPEGYKIATVNNTYAWALERGLTPSVYAQLDARAFNERFLTELLPNCRYLLCSQVHPSVFDKLQGFDVHIWHSAGEREQLLLDAYYLKKWSKVPGGSTIGSRTIYLLYLLGVRTIRVYGMDCCYDEEGAHHAYEQKENNTDNVVTVNVDGKKFLAATWMVAQLDEMLQIGAMLPEDLNISFEGDGLLQHVIEETGARGEPPPISLEK